MIPGLVLSAILVYDRFAEYCEVISVISFEGYPFFFLLRGGLGLLDLGRFSGGIAI